MKNNDKLGYYENKRLTELIKTVRYLKNLGKTLSENGIGFSIVKITEGKLLISNSKYSLYSVFKVKNKIRKLFKEEKFDKFSTWNPYNDVIMFQWLSQHFAIWYETTIDKIPKQLLPDGGKCHYVDEMVSNTRYVLKCNL